MTALTGISSLWEGVGVNAWWFSIPHKRSSESLCTRSSDTSSCGPLTWRYSAALWVSWIRDESAGRWDIVVSWTPVNDEYIFNPLPNNPDFWQHWNECFLTPFSIFFQLNHCSNCTCPCFSRFFASTPHNTLSKPLATFLQYPCRNYRQRERMNLVATTFKNPQKEYCVTKRSNLPPVLKSCMLLTEVSGLGRKSVQLNCIEIRKKYPWKEHLLPHWQ